MRSLKLFVILFLCGILKIHAQSPISVNDKDMPKSGNYYVQSQVAPTADFQINKLGANQTWDFSQLKSMAQMADTFKSMADVNQLYKLYFIKNAPNLVVPAINIGMDTGMEIPVKNPYSFIKNGSKSYAIIGAGFEMQGFPLAINYEKQDVVYTFPLEYKKQDSSFSAFSFSFPNMFYYHQEQMRHWKVDAWGKITTPYGSWEALRIETKINATDSFQMDTLKLGTKIKRPQTVEYKWIAKNMGQAVMTVTGSMIAGKFVPTQASYLDSSKKSIPSYISSSMNMEAIAPYPNPCKDVLHFENNALNHLQITLSDITGRSIMTWQMPQGKNIIDVSSLKPGVYLIQVNQSNVYKIIKTL